MPRTLRSRIDEASLPLMTKLSRMPKLMPFLIMVALLAGGFLIGGSVGFALLGVAASFLAWVLYLSWPRLSGSERIMRLAVLMLAVAMAVIQLFPRAGS